MLEQGYKFYYLLLFYVILNDIEETNSVQVLSVDIPRKVKMGSQISLACVFDLQGKSLYTLNWWKDYQQFYQFSPTASGNKQVHETHGIEVVLSESNLKIVTLRNVTKATSGEFKCEIVADFPSYERDSLSGPMEVIEVPSEAPIVSVGRIHYRVGDLMEANCSSPRSDPLPSLSWHINGKEIPSRNGRIYSTKYGKDFTSLGNSTFREWNDSPFESESNPGPVTSEVFLVMKHIHFMHEGRAVLTCVASIPDLYHSATSVQLTLPGIKPLEPSLRVANSQMNSSTFSPQLCIIIILINILLTFAFDFKLHLISLITCNYRFVL